MNQTNVLSLRVARGSQGPTDGAGEAKANGHRLGATEAGLPLTPQRLELVKAYANTALRHAPAPSASQIAQRFAPRAEDVPPSGDAELASQAPPVAPFAIAGDRDPPADRRCRAGRLAAEPDARRVLAPPDRPAMVAAGVGSAQRKPRVRRPSPSLRLPVLSAPARLEAAAGEDVLLPLALDGTDGVPAGSVIVIKGLPPGSALSNGHAQGATDWTLRPDEIGDLHLVRRRGQRRVAADHPARGAE